MELVVYSVRSTFGVRKLMLISGCLDGRAGCGDGAVLGSCSAAVGCAHLAVTVYVLAH